MEIAAETPTAEWYYQIDQQQQGPLAETQMIGLIGQGAVGPDTLIWKNGMANWLPASQCANFSNQFSAAVAYQQQPAPVVHPQQPAPVVATQPIYCRNCSSQLHPNAVACVACGVPPGVGETYCPTCKATTHPAAIVCVSCGCSLTQNSFHSTGPAGFNSAQEVDIETALRNMNTKDHEYYRQRFNEIQQAGGGFKLSFNPYALLCGVFWYFHHRLYFKGGIYLAIAFFTLGLPWVFTGFAGNYDLYLKYVKGKDLW